MKIYIISELYDVDGGFGDAITQTYPMFATKNKELAEAYVEKYNNPVVYEKPYDELYHHGLEITEMELEEPDLNVDPWKDEEEN